MRILTAEFFALFAATGPLSSLQNAESFIGLDAVATCNEKYTVQRGDTCNSIAAAEGVPTNQIICQNPAINAACTNLAIDESICLGHKGNDCRNVYTVRPGDTCVGIASKHDISLKIFLDNNCYEGGGPNQNCTNIYPGEVLCVAKTLIGPKCPWACDKD